MLHFIEPQNTTPTNNNGKPCITYWKLVIQLPNVNALEFKVSSIKKLADIIGIKETTLRRIVYDQGYHSKKYDEFLKCITLTPHYD